MLHDEPGHGVEALFKPSLGDKGGGRRGVRFFILSVTGVGGLPVGVFVLRGVWVFSWVESNERSGLGHEENDGDVDEHDGESRDAAKPRKDLGFGDEEGAESD